MRFDGTGDFTILPQLITNRWRHVTKAVEFDGGTGGGGPYIVGGFMAGDGSAGSVGIDLQSGNGTFVGGLAIDGYETGVKIGANSNSNWFNIRFEQVPTAYDVTSSNHNHLGGVALVGVETASHIRDIAAFGNTIAFHRVHSDANVIDNGEATTYYSSPGPLTVKPNGQVGINIVNPAATVKLHVHDPGTGGADHAYAQFTTGKTGVAITDGMTVGYAGDNNAYVNNREESELFISAGRHVALQSSGGNVGIGTATPNRELEVDGGVRLNTAMTKPTCDAATRGTLWITQGGGGVKDNVEVCAKDSADSYDWRTIY